MSLIVRLFIIVLAVTACERDPWAELKPHQMLEKAEQLFLQNDPNAEKALRTAYDKAIRAEIDFVRMRNYALPLFQFYALRGNLSSAEPLFDRINRPQEDIYVYPHAANNLAILYARAGRIDDARRVMAKMVHTFEMTSPITNVDRRSARMAMLANIDRMASAAGDAELVARSAKGMLAQLQDLSRFQQSRYWPLEPGVKPFLERYENFLRQQGRSIEAEKVVSIVELIERNAPSDHEPTGCITQGDSRPAWCILEAS